jgi:hypothetical protein
MKITLTQNDGSIVEFTQVIPENHDSQTTPATNLSSTVETSPVEVAVAEDGGVQAPAPEVVKEEEVA